MSKSLIYQLFVTIDRLGGIEVVMDHGDAVIGHGMSDRQAGWILGCVAIDEKRVLSQKGVQCRKASGAALRMNSDIVAVVLRRQFLDSR